jgi:hypothetical protein
MIRQSTVAGTKRERERWLKPSASAPRPKRLVIRVTRREFQKGNIVAHIIQSVIELGTMELNPTASERLSKRLPLQKQG